MERATGAGLWSVWHLSSQSSTHGLSQVPPRQVYTPVLPGVAPAVIMAPEARCASIDLCGLRQLPEPADPPELPAEIAVALAAVPETFDNDGVGRPCRRII